MAAEDKKSPFTFKRLVYSACAFVLAGIGNKLLDNYFDITLLQYAKDWLLGVWNWLIQDKPQPNWLLVGFVVSTLILGYVIFYFVRLYSSTLSSLNEERASKAVPTTPELTSTQTYTLMRLGTFLESGEMLGSITTLANNPLFNSLENEVALEKLELMGLVQFTNPAGTSASKRKPVLTLKGKEIVLARRKTSAEKAQQKAKDAAPAS